MKKRILISMILIFLSVRGFSGQTETPADSRPWTAARLEHEMGGSDPIGGFNRAMFVVTDFGVRYIVRPVGIAWTTILPRPVIRCIDSMCENLQYPKRVVTCLGTAEWIGAGDETVRFFVNSTLGIAGLFDPARYWFHFYTTDSDFGRMFAIWGIGPGCTFMLPFCSFVNVRDGVGAVFDMAFDGRTYVPYSSWTALNGAVLAENSYRKAMDNAPDRYHMFRTSLLAQRELRNRFWFYHAANAAREEAKRMEKNPPPAPEDPVLSVAGVKNPRHINAFASGGTLSDTMRALYFRPRKDNDYWYMRLSAFNSDFEKKMEKREWSPAPEKAGAAYLFRAPDPEKNLRKTPGIVLLLPGIGAAKNSTIPLAMAELFHDAGYFTVVTDSAFTSAFSESAGGGMLPGYAPRDAENLRRYLAGILSSLRKDGKLPENAQVTLLGWSFGGLHTMHIAALEEKENLLHASKFVAINPPANLEYALDTADKLSAVSARWTRDEAVRNAVDAVGGYLVLLDMDPGSFASANPCPVPFGKEQSAWMISESFHGCLRDVLLKRHEKTPLPALKTDAEKKNRMALLEEIDAMPFRTYVTDVLLRDPSLPGTFEKLRDDSGLRALENTIRSNEKIRILHTANDFLLNESDRDFLSRTAGPKIVWFGEGGHLGNLYTDDVRKTILTLADPETH